MVRPVIRKPVGSNHSVITELCNTVCDLYYCPWFVYCLPFWYYLGLVFILISIVFSEIVYHVRGTDEAAGGVRSRVPDRAPLPYLAPRHLAALRELHHAPHHTQHHSAHVQGRH